MDGETEQYNQELETYLHIFCDGQPHKWLDLLPMAEFAHNSAVHSVMGKSPFSLILGYEPRSYPPFGRTFLPALEQRLTMIEDSRKEAEVAHQMAQLQMKERSLSRFKPWKAGDKVWLEARNLKLQVPSQKLSQKRTGPFEITQVVSSVAFRLKLPAQWKIHDVFHASLLSPYRETPEHGPNFTRPPPELIGTEEEYEIDKVVNHRGISGQRQYLIHWKGYSAAERTWETESNLENAKDALREYKRLHDL